jgi:hypothetical protein
VIRTDDCSEKTLAPRLTCKVIYRFAPTSDGTFADSSTIPSNDPDKNEVVVNLSGIGVAGSPVSITLDAPDDEQEFTTCSLYAPPTFQWTPSEPFKSISLQFSLEDDFSTVPVKATGKAGINELLMKNSLWKKVLSLPGSEGGTAYWKVVGTRDDKTLVESDIFSIEVEEAAPVLDPAISHTSRTELPPPTLSWGNNCNVKFKAWFANDPDFMKRGVKKKALSFKVKNPNDNGGGLIEPLTPSQWQTIRKLVGDETGATLFWYVESWDGLKSYNQTAVMSFELTD